MNVARQLQTPDIDKKDEEDQKSVANRRPTVAQLTTYHNDRKGKNGQEINLEKMFRKRFENMGNFVLTLALVL